MLLHAFVRSFVASQIDHRLCSWEAAHCSCWIIRKDASALSEPIFAAEYLTGMVASPHTHRTVNLILQTIPILWSLACYTNVTERCLPGKTSASYPLYPSQTRRIYYSSSKHMASFALVYSRMKHLQILKLNVVATQLHKR